jgi:hypothetical protein
MRQNSRCRASAAEAAYMQELIDSVRLFAEP